MSPIPLDQRLLLNINDACVMISRSRATVYKLIGEGKIRAKKDGGRTLIPVEELKRYAADLPDLQPTPPP